jgi:hypothetical protein
MVGILTNQWERLIHTSTLVKLSSYHPYDKTKKFRPDFPSNRNRGTKDFGRAKTYCLSAQSVKNKTAIGFIPADVAVRLDSLLEVTPSIGRFF